MSNFWIYENHTEGYEVRWKINKILHHERTRFQELAVVDTVEWGKALVLDGALQISEKDEFIYHEMIVHPGLNAHNTPEKVLIIGGGDGGTLREVVKHHRVQSVDLVEIDERVIAVSQQFFPEVSYALGDNRVTIHVADGLQFVREVEQEYDVVIVDSSDPVGPAVQLFGKDFYQDVFAILKDDGMLVVQSESPLFYQETFQSVYKNLQQVFPQVHVYLAAVPTYVSGPWSFTIGSKKYNPQKLSDDREHIHGLKYYNEDVHQAAFSLPQFINEMLR